MLHCSSSRSGSLKVVVTRHLGGAKEDLDGVEIDDRNDELHDLRERDPLLDEVGDAERADDSTSPSILAVQASEVWRWLRNCCSIFVTAGACSPMGADAADDRGSSGGAENFSSE